MSLEIKCQVRVAKVDGDFKSEITVYNNDKENSEQILTLNAQLFNVHTTWKKEKDKQTCSKKGKGNTQPTDKKISNSENLNCSTKPKLILSDKILTPMSKGIVVFEDILPESWLPTFLGKFVQCKSRLCFEMVTKSNQYNVKKWFIPVRIDPHSTALEGSMEYYDSESSSILRRTNPFLTKFYHENPPVHYPRIDSMPSKSTA